MNHCYQVEEFFEGECMYDKLFASAESADADYEKQLKRIKKKLMMKCSIRKGSGIDEYERLHMHAISEETYLRLTVRKIEP